MLFGESTLQAFRSALFLGAAVVEFVPRACIKEFAHHCEYVFWLGRSEPSASALVRLPHAHCDLTQMRLLMNKNWCPSCCILSTPFS